jgi:hypothetical protein
MKQVPLCPRVALLLNVLVVLSELPAVAIELTRLCAAETVVAPMKLSREPLLVGVVATDPFV